MIDENPGSESVLLEAPSCVKSMSTDEDGLPVCPVCGIDSDLMDITSQEQLDGIINSYHLTPAPFDEKNACTDWIDDMMDSGQCVWSKNKFTGFFGGHVVYGYISGNMVVFWSTNPSSYIMVELHNIWDSQKDMAAEIYEDKDNVVKLKAYLK